MSSADKKIELIEWLVNLDDKMVLEKILELKQLSVRYGAGKIEPMNSEQFKSILDQAEEEFRKRQVISQDDLEREINNW